MTLTQWQLRREFITLLSALLGTLLCACGGGSDESSSTVTTRPTISALRATPPANDRQAHKRRALAYNRQGITGIVVASDGTAVGVANSDGSVRLLDASASRETKVLKPPGGAVAAGLVFSANGQYLAGVGRDSVVQVWNVATGAGRFLLHGHEHAIRSIAASADGAVIATGGEETRVMVWDGVTGRLKRIFSGHTDFVN